MTVVGIGLAVHGMVTDIAVTYQAGMLILLVGLAGLVMLRAHCNTLRLVAHQAMLAKVSADTRQQYAEMGWRAAQLDATLPPDGTAQDARVFSLPSARQEFRRSGA